MPIQFGKIDDINEFKRLMSSISETRQLLKAKTAQQKGDEFEQQIQLGKYQKLKAQAGMIEGQRKHDEESLLTTQYEKDSVRMAEEARLLEEQRRAQEKRVLKTEFQREQFEQMNRIINGLNQVRNQYLALGGDRHTSLITRLAHIEEAITQNKTNPKLLEEYQKILTRIASTGDKGLEELANAQRTLVEELRKLRSEVQNLGEGVEGETPPSDNDSLEYKFWKDIIKDFSPLEFNSTEFRKTKEGYLIGKTGVLNVGEFQRTGVIKIFFKNSDPISISEPSENLLTLLFKPKTTADDLPDITHTDKYMYARILKESKCQATTTAKLASVNREWNALKKRVGRPPSEASVGTPSQPYLTPMTQESEADIEEEHSAGASAGAPAGAPVPGISPVRKAPSLGKGKGKKPAQTGDGVKRPRGRPRKHPVGTGKRQTIKYVNDPNVVVHRLNVLAGAREAGNDSESLRNEIMDCLDFLSENRVVGKAEHKMLYEKYVA